MITPETIVGSRIWFAEEKRPYRVRVRDARFLICTKPFNPRRTVLYCIVDLEKKWRGPENLIFEHGAETDPQCRRMLRRLNGKWRSGVNQRTEVSRRRGIVLNVTRVENAKPTNSNAGITAS